MRVRRRSIVPSSFLTAACLAALTATPSRAAPLCTPDLAVMSAQLSEVRAWQRIWTARITVDASACAATSGRFFIRFVRMKEGGPDLPFSEPFTWRPGVIEVSTIFAADEAVLDFSIGYVRPCACRAIGARSAYPGEVDRGSPTKDMRQPMNPERIPIPQERNTL